MNVGQRMKMRRKEIKLSADDVAEKLGVSRSTIFRYEKGEIEKLPINILDDLANILQTTPAYLMGWDDDSHSDLLPVFNQLEPSRKEYVYSVVKNQLEEQKKIARLSKFDTLAAHSDDPNRTYSKEEIEFIKKNLERIAKENNVEL